MKKQKRQRSALFRYLRGAVFFSDDFLSLGQNEPDLIHEDTGRIGSGKGAPVKIYRPACRAGWRLPFELICYEDTIAPSQIVEALEYAGLMVGLADYRPEYGRFSVEWED